MSSAAPFSKLERMMAWRYLRAKKEEGFVSIITVLSLLGITLGVATLVVVMSVMNGFRQDLLDTVIGVSAHVTVEAEEGALEDPDFLMQRLLSIEGVVQALPQIQRQALIASGDSTRGAVIRGVRPEDLASRKRISQQTFYGSFEAFLNREGLLLGTKVADSLQVRAGETLSILRPDRSPEGLVLVPRRVAAPVAGIFQSGLSTLDDRYVFMPLEMAQKFFDLEGQVTAIEIYGPDLETADILKTRVSEALGQGFRIRDWRDENANFVNALDVERAVMFITLTLVILVAAFNIISGQTMQVKAKTKNIAILRTMGASKGNVMRVFLLAGGAIGVGGTLAGLGLGLLISSNLQIVGDLMAIIAGTAGGAAGAAEVAYISRLPVLINPVQIGAIAVLSFSLALVAAIYPAWRATRIDPVESLRYE